ncbi:MAG: PIG-L deacetylase family protein [Acidimicrobiales bacterium]
MVVAHPDDVDFGAAGTVATWVDEGIDVSYCLVTDGDAGGSDLAVARSDMVGIRRAEQTEAAKVLGVETLVFLGYPDGRVVPSLDLRRDISRVIRQLRPDRVLTQSPERNFERIYVSHPDHLATGEAALCAVYPDARNPFAHPKLAAEGLAPHSVAEVWLMGGAGSGPPDGVMTVDITRMLEAKVAALRCHASQMGPVSDLDGLIRGWTATTAEAAGLPSGHFAESFRVIDTR